MILRRMKPDNVDMTYIWESHVDEVEAIKIAALTERQHISDINILCHRKTRYC